MWNFGVNVIVILFIIVLRIRFCANVAIDNYGSFGPEGYIRVGGIMVREEDYYSDYNYEEFDYPRAPDPLPDYNSATTPNMDTSTISVFDANITTINNTEGYDSVTLRYNSTDTDNDYSYDYGDFGAFINNYFSEWKEVKTSGKSLCPVNETCARKCCPPGKAYHLRNHSCIPTDYEFRPPIWQGYSYRDDINAAENLTFLHGRLSCRPGSGEVKALMSEISEVFRLGADGHLYMENTRVMSAELDFKPNKYCMDFFVNASEDTNPDALICYVPNDVIDKHYLLSGICMIVTCFLVLLRLLVFAWVPELQTLHGKILMAYLISFMMGFLLLGLEQFLMMEQVVDTSTCVTLTVIVYFSTLSAFFWRNVMCYDIWWTFSGLRSASVRSSARTRFRLYCAYAFGGPIALTIVLSSIEFSDLPKEHPLMPRIRINCFLFGYGRMLYFLGPLMLLFLMNMIFFALTAVKIAIIKRQTKVVLQSKDSNCTQQVDTQRFTLYVKLFGSMAFLEVNLILEVITIFYSDTVNILHFSDIFNVLAPLVIIVNFLCRPQTWRMIKKRFRRLRDLPITPLLPADRTLNSKENDATVTHL